MPVNGNDTREIINPPFTTFPYPAVAAIDVRYLWQLPDNTVKSRTGKSSGIFITPNHVLTAGHSVFAGDLEGEAKAIRVTPSNIQHTLPSRDIQLFSPEINVNSEGINYLYSYKPDRKKKDDIALLTTNQALLDANNAVGIIAFVNPENAIEKTIRTAGYPGDNISLPDYSGRGEARDLVLSPGSAYSPGRIIGVIEERRFVYSQDVDTFKGQSGGGVWHTLEGDNQPRVLGVHTEAGSNSKGVLITYDAYNQIMDLAEGVSSVIADELPENAIIGSDPSFLGLIGGNDQIVGTYRRERIIGQKGNDIIFGEGADDRLEGGEGDDKLIGGAGNDQLDGGTNFPIFDPLESFIENDVAIFSGNMIEYQVDINTLDGILGTPIGGEAVTTITHLNGGIDGVDTLTNIEYVQFKDLAISLPFDVDNPDPSNLRGGTGDDNLVGNILNNTIFGDLGNDTLDGGSGNDTIYGQADRDRVLGDIGNDKLFGDLGNDTLAGGAGKDTLNGGSGSDVLYGQADNDRVFGLNGNDRLLGDLGNDTVGGGNGNDTLNGGSGNDVLYGQANNDRVFGLDGIE